jgi:transposase
MRVIGLPSAFYYLARHAAQGLSGKAKERWRLVSCFEALGKRGVPSQEASSVLGVPRSTLYRWRKRLRERGPKGLEDASRRPRHLRQPKWSVELVEAVQRLREKYPRWGKDKLVVLLDRCGSRTSASTVGRILKRLKGRGVLREPLGNCISAKKRRRVRAYAVRKPKDYQANLPGELVQIDTLDVRPLPGVALKHFTARDVISRWDVVEVHGRAIPTRRDSFLKTLEARMPFPVKAIQVDGGSEFQAGFEEACKARGSSSSSCHPDRQSSTATWKGPRGHTPIPIFGIRAVRR